MERVSNRKKTAQVDSQKWPMTCRYKSQNIMHQFPENKLVICIIRIREKKICLPHRHHLRHTLLRVQKETLSPHQCSGRDLQMKNKFNLNKIKTRIGTLHITQRKPHFCSTRDQIKSHVTKEWLSIH